MAIEQNTVLRTFLQKSGDGSQESGDRGQRLLVTGRFALAMCAGRGMGSRSDGMLRIDRPRRRAGPSSALCRLFPKETLELLFLLLAIGFQFLPHIVAIRARG